MREELVGRLVTLATYAAKLHRLADDAERMRAADEENRHGLRQLARMLRVQALEAQANLVALGLGPREPDDV